MYRPNPRSDAYAWMSTAYHEAGHAVAVLLLGRTLYLIEVKSKREGVTWSEDMYAHFVALVYQANEAQRVSPQLLRFWLDEYWILDAGAIAEAEFNLISEDELAHGSMGDAMRKYSLIPILEEDSFLEAYYYRHVGAWVGQITAACRTFFRQPRVSSLTRTLAEALLRTRRMEGEEVIDTILANRAALTGQRDLFWMPFGADPFIRREAMRPPTQYHLI